MTDLQQAGGWTPGPWRLDDEQGRLPGYTAITAKGWIALAEVVTRLSHEDEDHQTGLANARLIAAAPAMAKAAQEMADDYQTSDVHHPQHVLVPLRAFSALLAALSLATQDTSSTGEG